MKKLIDITQYEQFLSEYKKSHGVNATTFIDMAIKEKIFKVKQEIKLIDNATNRQ